MIPSNKWYKVKYSDGDIEEYDEGQLRDILHPSELPTRCNAHEEAIVGAAVQKGDKRRKRLNRVMHLVAGATATAIATVAATAGYPSFTQSWDQPCKGPDQGQIVQDWATLEETPVTNPIHNGKEDLLQLMGVQMNDSVIDDPSPWDIMEVVDHALNERTRRRKAGSYNKEGTVVFPHARVKVKFCNLETQWTPMDAVMRQDAFPLVQYVYRNNLENGASFSWAKTYLENKPKFEEACVMHSRSRYSRDPNISLG